MLIKCDKYKSPIQNLHVHRAHQIQTHMFHALKLNTVMKHLIMCTCLGFKVNMITSILNHKGRSESCHHGWIPYSTLAIRAAVISLEQEELIWQKGALGVHSPDSLLQAVFYTVGLHFYLRGGQEHPDLKRFQFARIPTNGYASSTYYQYVENGSKNYQGRFSEMGQAIKMGRAYAQPNSSDRCPVRILDLLEEAIS